MRKFEITARVFEIGKPERNIKVIVPSVSQEHAAELLLTEYRKQFSAITILSTTELIEMYIE